MSRLLAPPADDRVKYKGTVSGVPTAPPVDPSVTGVRFVVTDSVGTTLVDALVPGGPEWNVNPGRAWSYKNKISPVAGINKVTLKSRLPGEFKFVLSGRDGTYLPPAGSIVTATLILDPPLADAGQCGEATFTDAGTQACRLLGGGSKLLCK
jgi:hypothetical protein